MTGAGISDGDELIANRVLKGHSSCAVIPLGTSGYWTPSLTTSPCPA